MLWFVFFQWQWAFFHLFINCISSTVESPVNYSFLIYLQGCLSSSYCSVLSSLNKSLFCYFQCFRFTSLKLYTARLATRIHTMWPPWQNFIQWFSTTTRGSTEQLRVIFTTIVKFFFLFICLSLFFYFKAYKATSQKRTIWFLVK